MSIDTTILEHPLFERQLELEKEMRTSGIERFRKNVQKAVEKGKATDTMAVNRMVSHAHDKFVEAINKFLAEAKSGRAGPKHSAIKFIEKLDDADAVANIASRVILDEVARKSNLTKTALAIGSIIENEVNSRKFEDEMPRAHAKFLKKANQEKLERRRWSHLLFPARLLGLKMEEWDEKSRLLLGVKLIDLFIEATGMVEKQTITSKQGTIIMLAANEVTLKWIEQENSRLEHLFPIFMPTIIPPRPWTSPFDGGYYTAFRRLRLVKTHNVQYLEELAGRDLSQVYAAVNALQDTAWAVNTQVLDVIRTLYESDSGVAGLPNAERIDPPTRPFWLPDPKEGKMDVNDMTPEQVEEFRDWKSKVHQTHKLNAEMQGRRAIFLRTLGVAEKFKDEEAIYFPHTLDWRGRAYPLPLYLTPQGNDMQRGLLTFANAVPIHDEEAARWLAIHGAGCWGYDKVDLDERVQWVLDHEEQIIASARNPYDNRFWMDADKGEKKWQFLAFCFEWAGFCDEGYGYMSTLPVQMDGTCNGLQNFSAMLLDEIGGAAVNLLPADKPQDIYQMVADLVVQIIERDLNNPDEEVAVIARGWLNNVNRKVTKRPVMTLAYGARRFGFVKQVEEDTISEWRDKRPETYPFIRSGDDGKPYDFGYKAAQYMGGLIWDSVGEVVVAARAAMDWLQEASKVASNEGLPINWTTPVGFLVQQAYRVPNTKRVETTFNRQRIQITYQNGVGKIDSRRQASGISPNWVHSLDASHLMLTIGRSVREGIRSFSMIHDSYGTHAGNAWALAKFLREEFVLMYSRVDVLQGFKEELEAQTGDQLPPVPPKGKLDLQQVIDSPFFFA